MPSVMEKKVRVILDTNWYISATINRTSRRLLYNLIINNKLIIILSREILKEYKLVMQRDDKDINITCFFGGHFS